MTINESPATSTYIPPPTAAPPAKKSGCLKWGLIGCGSLLVLGGIFVVVLVVVVFGAMKKSDVYKEALSRAQNSAAVQAALGTPIEAGMMVSGSINVDTTGGHATLDFPISGPKGKAVVHVVATKSGEKWEYNAMTVKPENGPVIDLLAGMSPPPTSSEPATTTDTSATSATDTTATTDTATTATSSTSTQ
jgi:Cytochrome oxidase complex assembly protein 1